MMNIPEEFQTTTIKSIDQNEVLLITDGACSLTPGYRQYFGGWAFILKYGDIEVPGSGTLDYPSTNQAAELTAAIEGFRAIKAPSNVTLVSDSEYVLRGLLGLKGEQPWITRWMKNGWRAANGKPIINRSLWEILYEKKRRHEIVTPFWVKGHMPKYKQNDFHRLHSRCDEMAVAEAIGAYERSLALASLEEKV